MILQINTTGAWREVAEIEKHQVRQVKEALLVLLQALRLGREDDGYAPTFRIIAARARSPKVVVHLGARR